MMGSGASSPVTRSEIPTWNTPIIIDHILLSSSPGTEAVKAARTDIARNGTLLHRLMEMQESLDIQLALVDGLEEEVSKKVGLVCMAVYFRYVSPHWDHRGFAELLAHFICRHDAEDVPEENRTEAMLLLIRHSHTVAYLHMTEICEAVPVEVAECARLRGCDINDDVTASSDVALAKALVVCGLHEEYDRLRGALTDHACREVDLWLVTNGRRYMEPIHAELMLRDVRHEIHDVSLASMWKYTAPPSSLDNTVGVVHSLTDANIEEVLQRTAFPFIQDRTLSRSLIQRIARAGAERTAGLTDTSPFHTAMVRFLMVVHCSSLSDPRLLRDLSHDRHVAMFLMFIVECVPTAIGETLAKLVVRVTRPHRDLWASSPAYTYAITALCSWVPPPLASPEIHHPLFMRISRLTRDLIRVPSQEKAVMLRKLLEVSTEPTRTVVYDSFRQELHTTGVPISIAQLKMIMAALVQYPLHNIVNIVIGTLFIRVVLTCKGDEHHTILHSLSAKEHTLIRNAVMMMSTAPQRCWDISPATHMAITSILQ